MWQFIASTGYRYGLIRDRWVDERMDPFKATGAAIRFLIDLHAIFGDWATALASYNCGEFAVQRVINTQHVKYLDDFWDLFTRLPLQTARFVPRFMAVLLIVRNPAKYGFELPPVYAPLKWDTITVNKPIKLSALAASLGVDASELPFLNPELRYDSTPDRPYELKVPAGTAEKSLIAINTAPKYVPPEVSFSWHVVRSGDSLWTISRRYGTTVEMIIKLNGMRPPYLILPGHRIKVPGKGGVAD
jgi:membrane-bound lytic murein transglycosylase D